MVTCTSKGSCVSEGAGAVGTVTPKNSGASVGTETQLERTGVDFGGGTDLVDAEGVGPDVCSPKGWARLHGGRRAETSRRPWS